MNRINQTMTIKQQVLEMLEEDDANWQQVLDALITQATKNEGTARDPYTAAHWCGVKYWLQGVDNKLALG